MAHPPPLPSRKDELRHPRPVLPPRTPTIKSTLGPRRLSTESTGLTRPVRSSASPASSKGRTPPPLPSRGTSPSVFSGREGSTFSRRGESVTSPPPQELELFAHHCKVFYFSPDLSEESQRFISTALAALPPSHRAAYTRVQSRLRSQAHLHHLRVRISSFHALMSSTVANGSLSLPSRSDLCAPRSRKERQERLAQFIATWNPKGAGPLEPFFRGLWSVLRAQSRGPPSLGGAGPQRVVWEIDDATFLESGGPEFMHEAITIIKGVLGFEDHPLTTPPKLRSNSRIGTGAASQEALRTRSGSDPFTDSKIPGQSEPRKAGRGPAPPPPPSRSRRGPAPDLPGRPDEKGLIGSTDDTNVMGAIMQRIKSEDAELLLPKRTRSTGVSPLSATDDDDEDDDVTEDDIAAEEADLNKPRFRLWLFPAHIDDQEAESLMSCFPRTVYRTAKGNTVNPRFPLPRPGQTTVNVGKDLELGLGAGVGAEAGELWETIDVDGVTLVVPRAETEERAGVIHSGTGRMWVGVEERQPGWSGGRWFRFKRWWRRLFGKG